MEIKEIGYLKTAFPTKFGVPRQSGVSKSAPATLIFNEEYRVPEASGGFTDTLGDFLLEVNMPSEIKEMLPLELYECLVDCLKNDPRPSYIDTPSRVFGFPFDKYEVKFTVEGKNLTVISLCEI